MGNVFIEAKGCAIQDYVVLVSRFFEITHPAFPYVAAKNPALLLAESTGGKVMTGYLNEALVIRERQI
jgi:hypothetical protein